MQLTAGASSARRKIEPGAAALRIDHDDELFPALER